MFDPISLGLAGLSFGGSLLSGIGAKQASAKQGRLQAIADANAAQANYETLQRVNAIRTQLGEKLIAASDPKVAVAEAEAAGFNPVTWLSAGYGARVGALSDAYRLQVPEYSLVQASQVPQQHSMLSAFGGALSAGTNMLATQYRANQSFDLQMGKLALGLSATPYGGAGGSTAYGSTRTSGGAASSSGSLSAWLGGITPPKGVDVKEPETINLGYYGWKQDGRWPSGQSVEDEYGDGGGTLYGLLKGANDIVYNMYGTPFIGNWMFPLSDQAKADAKAANTGLWAELNKRGVSSEGLLYQWFGKPQ